MMAEGLKGGDGFYGQRLKFFGQFTANSYHLCIVFNRKIFLQLTVKICQLLRLKAKFLAVLRLIVNPGFIVSFNSSISVGKRCSNLTMKYQIQTLRSKRPIFSREFQCTPSRQNIINTFQKL